MKKKPRNILKGLLLSAIATVFNSNTVSAEEISSVTRSFKEEDANELKSSFKRIYKNVLKIHPSGKIIGVNTHRSHSSHSSHRSGSYVRSHSSHTSHISSSTSYGTRTRSNPIYTPTSSPSSTRTKSRTDKSTSKPSITTAKPKKKDSVSSFYSSSSPDIRIIKLGERTLTKSLYGNDVKMLVVLLVDKHYIRESWVSKKESYPIFDTKIEDAVKHFQKDAGLSQTGIVDESTLNSLEAWEEMNTSVSLGVRDLYYRSSPFSGEDVDELIKLLWEKGYAPDPMKLEKKMGIMCLHKTLECL